MLEEVQDYNALGKLTHREGREVLVAYSGLVYRVVSGEWKLVGRNKQSLRTDGDAT